MKDNLEKFIEARKGEFDKQEPSADVWSKVAQALEEKPSYAWVWKVAAVLLLVSTLGLIYERQFRVEVPPVTEVASPDSELVQVESYYTNLIAQKRATIKLTIQEKHLKDIDLLDDLKVLDEMYDELKKDLEHNTNNEKLINAMIRNLRLRVEILNKQLEILKQLEKPAYDEINV